MRVVGVGVIDQLLSMTVRRRADRAALPSVRHSSVGGVLSSAAPALGPVHDQALRSLDTSPQGG